MSQRVSELEQNWAELVCLARDFRCLRNSDSEVERMKGKLKRINPVLNEQFVSCSANALCSFFMKNYPFISPTVSTNYPLFYDICRCMLKEKPETKLKQAENEKIRRLYSLFNSTMIPVLESTRLILLSSNYTQIVYRGVALETEAEVFNFCGNVLENGTLTKIRSWTTVLR